VVPAEAIVRAHEEREQLRGHARGLPQGVRITEAFHTVLQVAHTRQDAVVGAGTLAASHEELATRGDEGCVHWPRAHLGDGQAVEEPRVELPGVVPLLVPEVGHLPAKIRRPRASPCSRPCRLP
jgi:hypothetical protein